MKEKLAASLTLLRAVRRPGLSIMHAFEGSAGSVAPVSEAEAVR